MNSKILKYIIIVLIIVIVITMISIVVLLDKSNKTEDYLSIQNDTITKEEKAYSIINENIYFTIKNNIIQKYKKGCAYDI